jgi:hypothetical protein
MKAFIASLVVLALAITTWAEEAKTDSGKDPQAAAIRRLPPLDASKLEPTSSGDWNDEDFSDEKNGVFISVVEQKQEQKQGKPFLVAGSHWGVVTESGVKWARHVSTSPQRVVTVRFRLAADTIKYLVRTPEAPLLARYIALRRVFDVEELSKSERLELIKLASRDARAAMRDMAVSMAGEYTPLSDAVPILCRALCDPCVMVANAACRPLTRYFFPADYREIENSSMMGSRDDIDRAIRQGVHIFARRVHGVRPDLVTDADLATIGAMYTPFEDPAELDVEPVTGAAPAQKPDSKKNNEPAPK